MRTWFPLFSLEFRGVSFLDSFTTPCELIVVNSLVRTVIFDAFHTLDSAYTSCMTPFPTVFTLWNSWIHVGPLNSDNKTSDIRFSVDKAFSLHTTLGIPDVNLHDRDICDVTLNPNPQFQNKKINRKKIKMRKKNKINRVYCL